MDLPLEIWQMILEYTDFLDQIRLRQVCRSFHLLSIYDFFDIPFMHKNLLTDDIIKQHPNIKYLNVGFQITNVSHLQLLTKLVVCTNKSQISNSNISECTNLIYLDISYNQQITNLNHCKRLEVLISSTNSLQYINECVNLKILIIPWNKYITDVNHCTQLEFLDMFDTNITDIGIKDCINLTSLDLSCYDKITDISHLTNLQKLYHGSINIKHQFKQIKLNRIFKELRRRKIAKSIQ